MLRQAIQRAAGVVCLAVAALAAGVVAPSVAAAAARPSEAQPAGKVLQLAIRTDGPKSLDPVQGSTTYDNLACAQIFETLVTFSYADPGKLEPLLLTEMPRKEEGGKVWHFTLKPGVRFHDNPCFPGGKGREVVTDDVFYSLKRVADKRNGLKNWWLLDGVIEGLNEFYEQQNAALDAGGTFDYDAPVSGFVKINDREFKIRLTEPVYRFMYTLSQFQMSIVPREAVEHYGKDFAFNPVGTGPFILDQWKPKQSLTLNRNPDYHDVRYPAREEWSREDQRRRLHRPAGERVPFVDRVEFTMFVQDQPMWLEFDVGNLGYIEVPNDYFEQAFDKRTKQLSAAMQRKGVTAHSDQLLDFIFSGFNMEDELLGGYTPEKRALRQAIHLAIDLNEINEAWYQGINVIYDGPIPPGLDGHPEGGRAPVSFRGPNLELARQKLAEAGYPGGRGLPPIRYFTSNNLLNQQLAEMLKRQLAKIGVDLQPQLVDFSTLIEFVNNKKAPMFGFAWGSDYPDAENNLALFYGPNESPGSNHYNYKNPEYDALYERILVMEPGPERTALYEKMRDMIIRDTPYVGSMARTRFYLIAPWLQNCRPTERMWNWIKYLDVDDSKRPGKR